MSLHLYLYPRVIFYVRTGHETGPAYLCTQYAFTRVRLTRIVFRTVRRASRQMTFDTRPPPRTNPLRQRLPKGSCVTIEDPLLAVSPAEFARVNIII